MNTIAPNTGKIYLLTDGTAVGPINLDKFHPLSTVSILEVYVEDGQENNVLTLNYAPTTFRKNWATHWFPLFYRGLVEHTLDGESEPRTFAQYITKVPPILTALNQNATTAMTTQVTVQQQTGANLIGPYALVTDLPTSYGDWLDLQDLEENDVIAYVWENGVNGFYKVEYDTELETYSWVLQTESIQAEIETKPYDVFNIYIQAGYGNPAPMVELTDEQYRLIWQELYILDTAITAIENMIITEVRASGTASDEKIPTEQAVRELVEALKNGTEQFTAITLYSVDGTAVLTFDGKDIIWNYRGINAEMFKNLVLEVEPDTGVTFTNGMNVMYAGSIGASGKRLAKPTDLTELKANPNLYLGMITQVTDDGYGIVNWYGEVNDLNTAGTTAGQPVYVDNAGGFTTTKPVSPLPQITIGLIERVSPTVGRISVRPNVGNYLGQLHDVYLNGHTMLDGEQIAYDGANQRFTYDGRLNAVITANPVKSVAYNGTTYLITMTHYDTTTTTAVTLSQLKTFIGEATSSLSGLMSSSDKSHLDTLYALLNDTTDGSADSFVDTIEDILAIFSTYPEGVDLVTVLAGKVNTTTTIAGVDLANDITKEELKIALDIDDIETGLSTAQADIVDNTVDISEHEQRIDTIEETIRKSQNGGDSSTATGTDIISLPKDVVKAPLKVQVDGMLLDSEQLLSNPNITTNTTGWSVTGTGASITYVSGRANLTGTSTTITLYQTGLSLVSGNKYTILLKVEENGIDLTSIKVYNGSTYLTISSTIPAGNNMYSLTFAVATTHTSINIQFTSATTINCYVDDIYLFNTFNQISNKQYSPLYSKTFDTMSDAEIKAQMDLWVLNGTLPNDNLLTAKFNKRLTAVGKNLFDGKFTSQTVGLTYTRLSENQFTVKATSSTGLGTISLFPNIKWKALTQYRFSGSIYEDVEDGNVRLTIYYTDGTTSTIAIPTVTNTAFNETSTVSKTISFISYTYSTLNRTTTYTNFMIEQGTVSTTYEPYVSTEMFLQANAEGYRVPNGTKDTIEIRDGKAYYVQRVQKYTLQASDISSLGTALEFVDIVNVKKNTDHIAYGTATGTVIANTMYIRNFVYSAFINSTAMEYKYNNSTTTEFYLAIPKGTYASLAAAQTALAGTVIYYQLATPVTTEISSAGLLNGYPSGTIYVDDVMNVACQYGTSAQVADTNYPITSLLQIRKMNGVETELSLSGATIAGDGLSFTHSGLTAGDIVYFEYAFGTNSIKGLTTVTYYDNPLIVVDSVTSTVYKLVPSVASGVLTWTPTAI